MKMRSKAKIGSYPDVNEGDKVRIQMIQKTPKGFKQQWSTDLHTVRKSIMMEYIKLMVICILEKKYNL